jgi:phosphatidylglycerol---prolipoprotein diacylglyceryl transferase
VHPLLFRIGSIPVPTYGVVTVLALFVAIVFIRRYARIEGLDPSRTTDAIVMAIAVGVVGARVLEIAINWHRYFVVPGGLKLLPYATGVFVGGLVSAIAFLVYWFRRIRLPMLQGLDILGLVGAIATGVGRWGCFCSGCCWGTPTDLPWAVTFPEIARRLHEGLPAVPIHPTQIYESLMSLAILGILAFLYRRKRFHGRIITVYVVLYSIGRFFLEFVRGAEERGFVLGTSLSTSQFACLVLAITAGAAYVALDRRHRRSGEPDWKPAAAMALAHATPRPGRRVKKGHR